MVQYLALLVHAQTRKKELIDKLYNLGLCISYDRVLQISTELGNTVCAFYKETSNVCSPKLRNGLFTTGCVDNIDHNPSSRTAKDSFHGTAITLTQHPEENRSGENRAITKIDPNIIKQKKLLELPKSYTEIRPFALKVNDFHAPKINGTLKPDDHLLPDAMATEYNWLGKVVSSFEHPEGSENSENVSWAAFHAATQPPITRPTAINALLPMFHQKARTHAMILHTMEIVENAAKCLDERQTPVIAMGQPLYALAKEIQWSSSTPYTKENYVVVLGGLHIGMYVLRLLGDWREECGWDSALAQASITTAGKANAFLKASHVTRTRYALKLLQKHCIFYRNKPMNVVMIVKLLRTGARGKPSNILNSCTGQ